jgi:hypothetical protein
MKHIKKFENINNNTFDISEISDIINEFADSFDIEDDDILIMYGLTGEKTIILDDLRKNPNELKKIEEFGISIPYENNIDDDFKKNCNEYIQLFEKMISLSGKLETLDCEIGTDSFWIDFDMNLIKLSIRKIKN